MTQLTTATWTLYATVCVTWGTTWLAIKIALETVPPLTAAGLRFLIAFPCLLAVALARREPLRFPPQQFPFFLFITTCYFTVPFWLMNVGETYVSSGLAALLFSTMPVFMLVFARLLLHEPLLPSQILGVATGFLGLLKIVNLQSADPSHYSLLGVLAMLSAAAMHALSYVITKRNAANISVITFNVLPIGVAGLLLSALGVALEKPHLHAVSPRSWLALSYLGVVASVAGLLVYFTLLKRMRTIMVSFVFLIFPVVALAIGAWYENTPLSPSFLFYLVVLLTGFAITKHPIERWHRFSRTPD